MKNKIKLLLVLTMTFILALPSLSVLAQTGEEAYGSNNSQVVEGTQPQAAPSQADPQSGPTQAEPQGTPAQGDPQGGNDITNIIKSIKFKFNEDDRFGKEAIVFPQDGSAKFEILLANNESTLNREIKKDEELSIKLVPEDSNKDFLYMEYKTSAKTKLVDSNKTPPFTVANLNMAGRDGVDLTFVGGSEHFDATLDLPFQLNLEKVYNYFDRNEGEESTTFSYKLKINDQLKADKIIKFTVNKPKLKDLEQKFYKTSGTYKQIGDLGEGNFHFNINIETKLHSPNEYVIYDLPDVNMGFEGEIGIYDGHVSPFGKKLLDSSPTSIVKESVDPKTGSKIKVYDVYFFTPKPAEANAIRVPAWGEKTLEFHRDDVEGKVLQSLETATVPENILFEKPMGEVLTDAEKKIIKDKGGLYKTVGKGFKVTISDYKSNYFDAGGWLTFVYRMEIKNPSPELDDKGHPKYKNFSTFYAQEIPTCKKGDKGCIPIKCEKNKEDANGSPKNPIDVIVEPGTIGADVTIPPVSFTKVEADANGKPIENKPLAGAKFTIYKLNKDRSREGIAKNADNLILEDLVTNKDGKLTKDGEVVTLSLNNGYYQFEETEAPEGYIIKEANTDVTVGYLAVNLLVPNTKLKYKVTYEFKSAKAGMALPQEVMQLLPIDDVEYSDGITLPAMQPESSEVNVTGGKWIFKGYDKKEATINKADVHFVGSWDFEKDPVKPNPEKPKPGKTDVVPKPEQKKSSPKTGDNQMIYVEIAICILSTASIYALRRRNQNKSN